LFFTFSGLFSGRPGPEKPESSAELLFLQSDRAPEASGFRPAAQPEVAERSWEKENVAFPKVFY
jgi:hypothetical protein